MDNFLDELAIVNPAFAQITGSLRGITNLETASLLEKLGYNRQEQFFVAKILKIIHGPGQYHTTSAGDLSHTLDWEGNESNTPFVVTLEKLEGFPGFVLWGMYDTEAYEIEEFPFTLFALKSRQDLIFQLVLVPEGEFDTDPSVIINAVGSITEVVLIPEKISVEELENMTAEDLEVLIDRRLDFSSEDGFISLTESTINGKRPLGAHKAIPVSSLNRKGWIVIGLKKDSFRKPND